MNPSVTFTVFIHAPLFGACFSHDGKRAKRVNGSASASAKPSIPIAGATIFPDVEKSTSRKPTIGPVHENDTMASVNAMRNMPSRPPVLLALLSSLLPHDDGSVISNHPKKERAKTTSRAKKKRLTYALVARSFSLCAP